MIHRGSIALVAWLMVAGPAACGSSQPTPTPAYGTLDLEAAEKPLAPLFDNLGDYEHPIATDSRMAQRFFNQGLTLVYGFNHGEAIRSFEAAAAYAPESPMPYWGIALSYGPNINAPMMPGAGPKAYAALRTAQGLAADGADPREQAYVKALSARYAAEAPADRSALDQAYADAMRQLAARYPDDLDAATLFAEALMDTSPWNYWTTEKTPRPVAGEAILAIESVLSRDPDHPGANHYYIHLMESGPAPQKALPSADRLRTLVPGAGHLVHMPSHIYVRLGLYGEASFANERAIQVDEDYLAEARAQGFYPATYYPHNVHFLWFTTTMEGRGAAALRAARQTAEMAHHGVTEAERFRALPMLVLLRFGQWEALLEEPMLSPEPPFAPALQHFARGLALTATRHVAEAQGELARLQTILRSPALRSQDSPNLPASAMVALAATWLQAEIDLARGRTAEGLSGLTEAVRMEDALPYMEPPYWHPPARHWLGAALLDAGRPIEAEAVYHVDLVRNPSNGWSLFGLSKCLRALGKRDEADDIEAWYRKTWIRADAPLMTSRY